MKLLKFVLFIVLSGFSSLSTAQELDNLIRVAEQGDPIAQATLSEYYQNGFRTKVNYPKALKWAQRSAAQNNPLGLFALAVIYDNGLGVQSDSQKSNQLYQQAFPGLQTLANQNNLAAQYALGWILWWGKGVPPDIPKASQWIQKSADQGHYASQYHLGGIALEGEDDNDEEALKWFQLAANQGLPAAQVNLGWMHYSGIGIEEDLKQSAIWYEKAALQGLPRAQFLLGELHELGEGVPEDLQKALFWYEKAAQQGDPDGQFALGLLYEDGWGLKVDLSQARQLFHSAARQNHKGAINRLGDLNFFGFEGPPDLNEAMFWYRKAKQLKTVNDNNYSDLSDGYYLGLVYETINQWFGRPFLQSPWALLYFLVIITLFAAYYAIGYHILLRLEVRRSRKSWPCGDAPPLEPLEFMAEEEIFTFSKKQKWSHIFLMVFCLIFGGGFIYLVSEMGMEGWFNQKGVIFFFIAGLFFLGSAIYLYWTIRPLKGEYLVNTIGIAHYYGKNRKQEIRWEDIIAIKSPSHERIVVKTRVGKSMALPLSLEPADRLLQLLYQGTPHLYANILLPNIQIPKFKGITLLLGWLSFVVFLQWIMLDSSDLSFFFFVLIFMFLGFVYFLFPHKIQIFKDGIVISFPFRTKHIRFDTIQQLILETEASNGSFSLNIVAELTDDTKQNIPYFHSAFPFYHSLYFHWQKRV